MSTTASSTSPCSRASVAGPVSAWPLAWTDPQAGLGAVGAYASLSDYTQLGGQLTVFELPN